MLSGKVAIITGASSGIGRAMALKFAAEGASIVCADRNPNGPKQKETTHEHLQLRGDKSIFVAADVSDESSVQNIIQQAVREYGRIDIMINNAGIAHEASHPQPIWETTIDVFDSTWKVNVRGVFLGCKYAGEQMLKQRKATGRARNGTIINVASVLGILGKPGTPAYAAAKGGVIAMTRAIAMDFAPHGIHCNSILPGFTRTPMISATADVSDLEKELAKTHPLQRLGEPDEIANAALFLASEMSDGITSLNMSVDGGLHGKLGV
ncbi:hypothetical protein N7456_008207 [Penicillium angulare]|uniref:Short-chain dehydrogenase/reductase SDR n=1 Tax=Penicillium angulare TaxID=116970 RepID=A0A9W9K9F8_9EURO|nr:hypothetical protein N7456_008207 [Penicillium angulare]